MLAPLPDVPLMPTGGVDESNAAAYLGAGAVAVATGSNLVDQRVVLHEDWAALTARARSFIAAVER